MKVKDFKKAFMALIQVNNNQNHFHGSATGIAIASADGAKSVDNSVSMGMSESRDPLWKQVLLELFKAAIAFVFGYLTKKFIGA